MTKLAFALSASLALVSISGCKQKSGVAGGGSTLGKLTELRDKMCACKDPDCARKTSDEVAAWSQQPGKKALNEPEQKQADELGKQMGDCMAKASSVVNGSAPSGSAPAPADGSGSSASAAAPPAGSGSEGASGLPKACDDYKAAIDRLSTCEALSKQARETLVKAFQDASEGWKKLPAAAKERIAVSCKAGADAVISTAKGQCGW